MQKDPELIRALDVPRRRFGDTMVVVDHWEADLTAVGVARTGFEQRLAYISVHSNSERPKFYVALENPPERGSEMPYANAGDYGDLSLTDAADIIAKHLGLP
jgi:hypothetical protein